MIWKADKPLLPRMRCLLPAQSIDVNSTWLLSTTIDDEHIEFTCISPLYRPKPRHKERHMAPTSRNILQNTCSERLSSCHHPAPTC